MNMNNLSKSVVCIGVLAMLAACGGGGGDGGGGNRGTNEQSAASLDPDLIIGSIADGKITVGSTLPFGPKNLPSVRIVAIENGNIIDPTASATAYELGKEIKSIGKDKDNKDILIDTTGKTQYLITLTTSASQPYTSPTRNSANETCAENTPPSGRLCSAEAGRSEALQVTWRAISNFKTPVNIGPLSTMMVERVKVRQVQEDKNLPFATVLANAESDIGQLFLDGNPAVNGIASIAGTSSSSINLNSASQSSLAALSLGMLERLAQQMARTADQNNAAAGYSAQYATLFASFARDGNFESTQAITGTSLSLRSSGSLLNTALTEHVTKDLPRYPSNSIANFRFQDFLDNNAVSKLRDRLLDKNRNLYGASGGSVANVAYISKDAGNKVKDHSITAIPARFGGVFFLDSRGEAQDGSKPAVRCATESFGLTDYEVTGVAALEGASLPLVLAYSHTDTRAVLIDVRQAGLDNAATATELACGLKDSSYRVIDFRDVGQNAALYQNAPQYTHVRDGETNARPVTLTGAAFNAITQTIKITTLDGVLDFKLVPDSEANNLPLKTRYAGLTSFSVAGGDNTGLSMNPAFDNTDLASTSFSSLWSAFDYNNLSPRNETLKGIFTLNVKGEKSKISGATDAVNVPQRSASFAQTGALARTLNGTSFAAVAGFDTQSIAIDGEQTGEFKGRNNCVDPAEPVKRYAAAENAGFGKIALFDASDLAKSNSIPKLSASLPVPTCNPNGFTLFSEEPNANTFYDTERTKVKQRYICRPNNPGGLPVVGGGTSPANPTYQLNTAAQTKITSTRLDDNAGEKPTLYGSCDIGYHGIASIDRYTGSDSWDVIGVAAQNRFIVEKGLVNSLRIKPNALTETDATKLAGAIQAKPFAVLSRKSTTETRSLILDDIRSYGIIRQRGTVNKSLAYFVAKDTKAARTYSLVEVDLDTIRTVQDATLELASNIPTTAAESKQIAGPIRVYFR